MDDREYERICSLTAFPAADATPRLSVTEERFVIIKKQLHHRHLRSALRRHGQDRHLTRYLARRAAGESSCSIATSVAFSPCMMARLLLKAQYGWSKTTIAKLFKEAMKDRARLDGKVRSTIGGSSQVVSEEDYAKVIPEIRECIDADEYYSPLADRVRHSIGQEYEDLLLMTLRNRQLLFESEAMLREKGLSKTPDVRLLLPIGVRDPKNGQQLHVVNWIDSKAMFGDRYTHETENASQLQGYVNRFGPGMVIYWFGFVAQLSSDSDVFVTDSFPREISLPGAFDPLASVTKVRKGDVVELHSAKVQTDFDEDWIPMTSVVCEW